MAEQGTEIERLRERLTFYESFDRLIHENIARSGDLLRQAMDLRESATREAREVRAEAEQQRLADRTRQRLLLSTMLDELIELQGQVERLARRVADALDEIEADGGGKAGRRQGEAAETAVEVAPPAPEEAAAESSPATGIEAERPRRVRNQTVRSDEAVSIDPAIRPFDPDRLVEQGVTSAAVATADETKTEVSEEKSGPRSMTVLVHGVPRAATALSLQRYLSALSEVEAVEPREYAEGVLRLQVRVRRPLVVGDLRAWDDGAGLEPIHTLDDVIEIRLPGTTGL